MKSQDFKFTTPLARKIAKEKNINIADVQGSGFNGRVLLKDIENFKGKSTNTTINSNVQAAKVSFENLVDKRTKPAGVRNAIAKAMKNSWANVAYTNLVVEVNATKLWNERKKVNEIKNVKLSFLPYVAKATIIALSEFPQLNATFDDKGGEIVQSANINMGIAVDAPAGLFVPVLKKAQDMNLFDISDSINTLAKKVRDGKITMPEMSGGTFTITNYGSAGALYGVPVINYPEIAILGVGAIVDRVYANNETLSFYSGKVMHLTVAADHRWVDGAIVGKFASRIKELLEQPETLYIEELGGSHV